jgi:hypothetical protein
MLHEHPETTAKNHGPFAGRWLAVPIRAATHYVCGYQFAHVNRDGVWHHTELTTRDDCWQRRATTTDPRLCYDCCGQVIWGVAMMITPTFTTEDHHERP